MAVTRPGANSARTREQPVAAAPSRRHGGDIIRLVAAFVLFAVTARPVRANTVPQLEIDVFRVANDLPSWLGPGFLVIMQLGNVLAAPALAALARRRVRLAVDLAAAGLAAWLIAKVVKGIAQRPRPGAVLPNVIFRGAPDAGYGFVSGHAAVSVALATAASPYLGRRWRRLVWGLAVVVCLSRAYVGAHFPLDVVGGAAVGWAIGAALHLAVGAPGARLRAGYVAQLLGRLGIAATDVRPAAVDARASDPYLARVGDRWLFVKVVTRDRRDADLLLRGWRYLLARWMRPAPPFTAPGQRVEHEAAMALLARAAGVRTPRVLAVGSLDNGVGILVQEAVSGVALDIDVGVDNRAHASDEDLRALWQLVATLHAARLVHGDLVLSNVLWDDDRQPWMVDFGNAGMATSAGQPNRDRAELLLSLAAVVGAERAVDAARDALAPDTLAAVVLLLRRPGLAPDARRVVRGRPDLVTDLQHRLLS